MSNTWSACRFSTAHREYTYYIVQHGQLDIAAMQQSAAYFVGEHDFRNFCKLDLEHVKSFRRRILAFQVKERQPAGTDGRALYALHVKGTAFLWHQVGLASLAMLLRRAVLRSCIQIPAAAYNSFNFHGDIMICRYVAWLLF